MSYHRLFTVIAGLSTLAMVDGPMMEMPRRIRGPSYYEEPRRKQDDGVDRLTKREKREMMQRDFALGGSRHGRKRRQRLHRCRHKE